MARKSTAKTNKKTETKVATEAVIAEEATALVDTDLAEIEAALGDIDTFDPASLTDDQLQALEAAEAVETPDVSDGEIESAVVAEAAKEASYEEQSDKSEVEVAGDDEVAAETKKAKAEKTPRARRADGPSVHDDCGGVLFGIFGGEDIVLDSEEGVLDEATFKERMNQLTQKKVRDKAVEMARYTANQGGKLSVYTAIAMNVVVKALEQGETFGTKELKAAMAPKYSDGTQAAQSGQMMTLLPAFGVVSRNGSVLTPNPNSMILDIYRSALD